MEPSQLSSLQQMQLDPNDYHINTLIGRLGVHDKTTPTAYVIAHCETIHIKSLEHRTKTIHISLGHTSSSH